VDPRFLQEPTGTTNDDHPHGDIRDGEVFMNTVYTAVTTSPQWKHIVLVFNFDEWGGFFEHVPPPLAPIPPASAVAATTAASGSACRPLSSRHSRRVASCRNTPFDHTSILRLIEWAWHLEPLTVRDATANNLATALDFERPDRSAPLYAIPPGPYGIRAR